MSVFSPPKSVSDSLPTTSAPYTTHHLISRQRTGLGQANRAGNETWAAAHGHQTRRNDTLFFSIFIFSPVTEENLGWILFSYGFCNAQRAIESQFAARGAFDGETTGIGMGQAYQKSTRHKEPALWDFDSVFFSTLLAPPLCSSAVTRARIGRRGGCHLLIFVSGGAQCA